MIKRGERLHLSPFQSIFKFLIKFVFNELEHSCPGVQYSSVHHRTLVIMFFPTSLTDKILNISPVPVHQDGF